MFDQLGFVSISIVSLITLIMALNRPSISTILFTALFVRVFFIFIGNSFLTLPDSTADAISFEWLAWYWAKDGFINHMSNYTGPSPKFVSWLVGVPYSLLGRSALMAQSMSLMAGIGSVFIGWKLAHKMWDSRTAIKVAWIIALFPSLILYSVLVLREVYIVFFLLVALYGVFNCSKNYSVKSFFIAIIGFVGATFFHGAMLVGAIVFIAYIGISNSKEIFTSLIRLKINKKIFTILLFCILGSGFYLSNKINVAYLGNFKDTINLNKLTTRTFLATRGTAAWPKWTIATEPVQLIYKIPARAIYFLFAPFPWDVSEPKHLIGMFDSILYMYLSYLIFKNRKIIWKDPSLRLIFIILLCYLIVFAVGVGNFGSGARHKSKFTVILILLAGPLIKIFSLLKKKSKNEEFKKY